MKILAIRLARFGDVVLLLPALSWLKSALPSSQISLLTDHRLLPLAEMCPAIDHVLPLDRIAMRDGSRMASLKSMYRAVRQLRTCHFDLAIDFHGFRETNLLAWLSGSRQRIGMHRFGQPFLNFCFNLPPVAEDKSIHVAEMFLRVARQCGPPDASYSLPPKAALVVPEASRTWAKATLAPSPYAAFYIDAPTSKRIWPPERFAATADYVAERLKMDVVAISGPEGDHLIRRLCEAARHPERIRGFSNLTAPQLAAVAETAQFWLSNDTGPMHMGPLLNVPTVGLFSIGLPEHFRPTGPLDRYIQGNPIETISVDAVIAQIEEMQSTDRRGLRR